MSWGITLGGFAATVNALRGVEARWSTDALYVVGTNVEYALYLEVGTSRMSPKPWLRPAVEEYRRNSEAFVRKNTRTSLGAFQSGDDVVRVVALAFERQLKANVSAPGGENPAPQSKRSPGTHPDHPKRVTGNLAGSIRTKRVR